MAGSERSDHTRRRIREKVLELLLQMNIEDIRVNHLAKLLDINRATFYRYYDSAYAVLQEIEDELFLGVQEISDSFEGPAFDDRYFLEPSPLTLSFIRYSNDHVAAFKALFGPHGDGNFIYHYRKLLRAKMVDPAFDTGYLVVADEDRELVSEYVIGGFFSIATHLSMRGQEVSDEHLAVLTYRLLFGALRPGSEKGFKAYPMPEAERLKAEGDLRSVTSL